MSASTCYAPLPALANKLLSGLRADDSVVSGDTRTHEGRRRVMTRASRLIARLPFSAARLPVNPGGEKRKKEKKETRAIGGGRVAPIDLCKLNLSVVFVNGVRGNRFVAVVV